MVSHDRTLMRRSSRFKLEDSGLGGSPGGFRGWHCLDLIPSGYLTKNPEKNKFEKIRGNEYLGDSSPPIVVQARRLWRCPLY